MLDRCEMSNLLQKMIMEQRWNRRITCWKPLTQGMIDDFPRLTVDELRAITVGIYQLKLAPAYAARQIALGKNFKLDYGNEHST
jgi:hypothetical protein